ncbi:MAG: carbohydrate ABC transporter permease, partial [Oscillospiraceae bacterium]|nr:carbohydrate ABC transporter permease [Oscillospiraceae bacterium]
MKKTAAYLLLTFGAVVMLYPLLWLLGASLKSNDEIFSSPWFMPESFDFSVYSRAWQTVTGHTMGHYFLNTFAIIIPKTLFAIVSSVLTAYGFARFDFPFKRLFYALFMGTMFMPAIVTIMPMYLVWSRLGALDTYI